MSNLPPKMDPVSKVSPEVPLNQPRTSELISALPVRLIIIHNLRSYSLYHTTDVQKVRIKNISGEINALRFCFVYLIKFFCVNCPVPHSPACCQE